MLGTFNVKHVGSVVTEDKAPNADTVATSYQKLLDQDASSGRDSGAAVQFIVQPKGCTLNAVQQSDAKDHTKFIGMRAMLFVGGLPKDKTIFSLVNEDASKVRYCHVFQASEPAIAVMKALQTAFMTFKTLEKARMENIKAAEERVKSPALVIEERPMSPPVDLNRALSPPPATTAPVTSPELDVVLGSFDVVHVGSVVTEDKAPNAETVTTAIQKIKDRDAASGQRSDAPVKFVVQPKGCTVTAARQSDAHDHTKFISMRAMLFVGGSSTDKTIFALVHEDAAKVRSCYIFQASEPAIAIMKSLQTAFMTFKKLVSAAAQAQAAASQ